MSTPRSRVAAVLALDIGGTQIRTAAILASGSLLGRQAVATPIASGAGAIVDACVRLLRATRDSLEADVRRALTGIGISSAGPIDPWRGLVVDPPNIVPLHNVPLGPRLGAALELPAYLERDTNVAALAEQWMGAARGASSFLYITVSTGLGGSIVRDGCLMLGPDGTAGELGHHPLMMGDGPLCGCGGRGHIEGIASGSGLARQANEAVAAGTSPFLAERARDHPLAGRDVTEGEEAGDAVCVALMERARYAFAMCCSGWVNMFNPERIVVGGTVAERQGDRLLGPARDLVLAQSFRRPAARVRIVPAELGDDVGLLGAWPLVEQRLDDAQWRRVESVSATPS